MCSVTGKMAPIIHAGLDESRSLTAETPWFVMALDHHFTSPAHKVAVNTAIYRHWPAQGVLSIVHVDSQRSPLVQLADFVAGSVYDWHRVGDPTVDLIQAKMKIAVVEDWRQIKARWMDTT